MVGPSSKRSGSRTRLERMVETLKEEIITGMRSVGDYLPPELELSKLFQLSKNTVRKGLDVLVHEGYIEKVPRIGARIIRTARSDAVVLKFAYSPKLVKEIHLMEMIGAFQKQYANIQVQAVPISYQCKPLNEDRLIMDQLDVLTINAHDFEHFVDPVDGSVRLEPLEPVGGIYPFLETPFARDGKLFALPFVFTPVILCYNREHFLEQELPEPDSGWTWEDLRQAGRALTNGNGRFGFYFHLPSANRWPIFLLQNNVVFRRDKQGGYGLNDPKAKEALELCKSLVRDPQLFPNFLSENNQDVHALFLNQNVSMILCTYDSLNDFRDAPFVYDIAPLPRFRESKTLVGAIALALSAASENKLAAKLFIDFFLSWQAQLFIRQNTLSIPALKRAAEQAGEGDRIANRPYRYPMFRDIIPSFHFFSDLQLPADHLIQMGQELKLYWSHFEPLEPILQKLEKQLSEHGGQ
ncbi:extracellular solute-binding protein [Paenibacillus mesophilus]|nr:extracellular solute-binding protein [Paenibacillus mesophilus]